MSLSVEFPGMSYWMIECTLRSILHLSKEVFIFDMPSLTFSFVTYSWDSESYILTTVYLFSDHPTSLAKRKTQHIILDPLSLQQYCKYLITIICNAINNNIICVRFEFLVPVFSFQVPHLNKFAP